MSKVIQEYPDMSALLHLVATMDGTTGHIEASEARGQQHLANSAQLPSEGTPGGPDGYRKANPDDWKAMGIEFGPVVDGDIFRDATLPEGWKVKPTDHSMWSKLLDNKGRERASIFYKAAFYDRSAHIDLCSRFRISRVYDEAHRWTGRMEVLDSGRRIFINDDLTPDEVEKLSDLRRQDSMCTVAICMCENWLAVRGCPDYKNPAMYWDTDL